MTVWTEKHLRIALEHGLTPSARDLYEYLVMENFEGKPQVLDLREFNRFITKRRGRPYDRRTVKTARTFLEDCGLLTACREFTAFVHHVTLRCIEAFFKPRKGDGNRGKSRSPIATLAPSTDSSVNREVSTTTTNSSLNKENTITTADLLKAAPLTEGSYLEQNLTTCEEAGIVFSANSLHVVKILSKTHPEEVLEVTEYCTEYAKRNAVASLSGLFLDALTKGYWKKKRKPLTLFDGLVMLCTLMGTLRK